MGFETLPRTGPVRLVKGQASAPMEFFVAAGVEQTFLRFTAVSRDNDPLGGEEPTFQIRAGTGRMTSVVSTAGAVPIRDAAGNQLGSVTCELLPEDMFLLTLTKPAENSEPWKLRIWNNDSEPLNFLGFGSQHAEQTVQPWLVLSNANAHIASRETGLAPHAIQIRNWGTGPLTLRDPPGTPLGREGSPIMLVSRPARVDPHRVGELMLGVSQVFSRTVVEHVLRSNDTVDTHGRISIVVDAPSRVPVFPVQPPSHMFCRTGCGCREYIPPPHQVGGACDRSSCRHSLGDHSPE
jgi:hypothetical protein